MIIEQSTFSVISVEDNTAYWEGDVFPTWARLNTLQYNPGQQRGAGVEPHYHDGDEFWLFTDGVGEVWLDGRTSKVSPNTLVYTPMGVVHRFQMFTDFANVAAVTRPVGPKRPRHLHVTDDGPPEAITSGFVVPGEENTARFPARGDRCPVGEFRLVADARRDTALLVAQRAQTIEYWLGIQASFRLTVDGFKGTLGPGDVAIIHAGATRGIELANGGAAVFVAE